MKTTFLSQKERQEATKYFMRFTLFNGLGFGFLADTTVYLLAIQFNASNIQLGYISSLIHLSGIILIISPKLLEGQNIIKVYFWTWLFRGLVAIINLGTLFTTKNIALFIVLSSYTLFCFIRSVGVSLYNPMMQIISTPNTLGNVVAHNNARFNLGNIFSKVTSYFISSLPFLTGVYSLLTLQITGVVLNTIGTFYLLKIPCRENIEKSKEGNVFSIFLKSLLNKEKIIPLLIHWNYISVIVISGFIVPLLKRKLGIEQNIIFLYSIATAISVTLSMYSIKSIIDRLSSKPVIIISSLLDVLFFILWATIKEKSSITFIFILGALAIFVKGINQSMINRNLISSIPQNSKVTYNSMISFFVGIIAFLTGVISGVLADIGEKYHPLYFNSYYLVFFLGSIFSLLIIFLTFFIHEKERAPLKEDAEFFLSFRNLKTLIDVYNFENAQSPEKRQFILMSLKYNSSAVATDQIRQILKNPLTSETEEVLKSLFTKPRPKLLPDILAIAKDNGSYHRATAIFALGAYPYPEVEKELIYMLDDKDSRVRSTAAKSLARINNKEFLNKFIEMSKDKENSIWDIMNYFIAIISIDEEGKYFSELFNIADYKDYSTYRESIFSLASRLLNLNPKLNFIYQKEKIEKSTGIKLFLSETRILEPFYKNSNNLIDLFRNENYVEIWHWSKELLKDYGTKKPYCYLKQGIINYNEKKSNRENSIAVIYFTFFVILNEIE